LTCSRRRKVQKISPRHQSKPLKPCGDGSIDVKALTFDITGFSRLHSTCLLERKGKNAYVGTYQWYIFG
jgi:hypothetical protein